MKSSEARRQYMVRARKRMEASQALDRLIAEANGEEELTNGERQSCMFLVARCVPQYKLIEVNANVTVSDTRQEVEGALIEAGVDPQLVWQQ